MTVRVHETYESATSTLAFSGDGEDSARGEFDLTNCPTSPEAYITLLAGNGVDFAGVPGEVDGMLLRTIEMAPNGPDAWRATCQYGEPKSREREKLAVGEFRIAFSAKTTSVKQYFAKNTTSYPAGAPNFGGAINVSRDGKVDGVDVVVPALSVVVTQRMAGASLTPAYALTVSGLIGKYNSGTFMGFPDGTMQLLAGDGSLSFEISNPVPGGPAVAPQDRELSFEFLFSPNLTGLTVGSITGIAKKGHQYMWVLWKDEIDGSIVVQKPRAVYVQDLFGVEPASFSPLGLGV